jgi:hypothetical protein
LSFDGLVRGELAKGFSLDLARARIARLYPALAREAITKNESGVAEFMACVSEVMKRDNCSRVAALSRARRENPAAYERYQNV